MANKNDYINMQKDYYEDEKRAPKTIVGSYDYHENFPYETNLLYLNGDIRKPIFEDFTNKKAFDIACGEGRMIRRMEKIFGQGCDGADISPKMVSSAEKQCKNSNIFVTDGNNCGAAPENSYDFVYCTISLQHIASYTIRSEIIRSILKILKPGGKVTLQLLVSKHYPYVLYDHVRGRQELIRKYGRLTTAHAGYFEDKFDAKATNSQCDCIIGKDDIPKVERDFTQYFQNVSSWLYDISIGRELSNAYQPSLPANHPNRHFTDSLIGTHFIFLHGEGPKK